MKKNHLYIIFFVLVSIKLSAQEVSVIDNKGTKRNINKVTEGTKPTTNLVRGHIHYNSFTNPSTIEIWDGTQWRNLGITQLGTKGSVFFAGDDGKITENNPHFFWDNNNNRLFIGNTPASWPSSISETKVNINGAVTSRSGFKANDGTASTPSFRFYNDANTGMFSPAADQLGFSTRGTLALQIDNNQNISINQNLSVGGSFIDSSGDAGTNGQILSSTATGTNWIDNTTNNNWLLTGNSGTNSTTNFLGTTDAQDLVFKVNNTESLRILNTNGFTGIGTLPTEKLDVNGKVKVRDVEEVSNLNVGDRIVIIDANGVIKKIAGSIHAIGDIKYSVQTTNHDGWYLLEGQAISSLPAAAQTAATNLGFTSILPNATDRVLKHSDGSQIVGDTGGAVTTTLSQANLPNYDLPTATTTNNGEHSHSNTFSTASNGIIGLFATANVLIPSGTTSTTTNGEHSHSVTVNSGGSETPFPNYQPYLVVNTFIYLGL